MSSVLYRVLYREAVNWAGRLEDKWFDHYADYGEDITPDFNEFFHGVHDDGSTYTLPDCFVVKYSPGGWDDEFIVVFTEHRGTHVFPEGELIWYARYEHRNTIPEWDNDHNLIEDTDHE